MTLILQPEIMWTNIVIQKSFLVWKIYYFLFSIVHCSLYIIVVYKLKYQARKNFSFQNIIKDQPSFVAIFEDDLILIAIFEDVIN